MALKRASLAFWLAVVSLSYISARADDGKSAAPQTKANPATAPPARGAAAEPTPAQYKEAVAQSVKMIQAMADESSKAQRRLELPDPSSFLMRFTRAHQADALRATGRAQARLGDRDGARASWQSALDAIAATQLEDVSERVDIVIGIADAQVEAGEKDESRFAVRQAQQLVRSLGSENNLPPGLLPPPGMDLANDMNAKTVSCLVRIARIQARAGDKTGSGETFRKAAEAAESIPNPSNRIHTLVELATEGPADLAGATWDRALALALAQKDPYIRYRGVATILQGRVKAGQVDPALKIVADRLGDDLKSYALWALADAIASDTMTVAPGVTGQLEALAEGAAYDRFSKRRKVYQRIAEARARLGDHEGAYHTIGLLHPENGADDFRAQHARILVMAAVGEAQLAAKQKEAARETARAALEMIAPHADESTELALPLNRFGTILAGSGDIPGAEEIVESLSRGRLKVNLLIEIAAVHAEQKRDADARAAIRRAVEASGRVPNDEIWELDNSSTDTNQLQFVKQLLATAQARIGDLDSALRTIGEFGDSPFAVFGRKSVIEEIVGKRLAADDIAGARRALDRWPVKFSMFRDDLANLEERIARQQAKVSDPMAVLELARKETTPRGKLQLLRGLADGIADRLAPKDAQKGPATH
ncbi:MAG: hypothetical protein ACYC61_27770 [Isosphaeraceae bacterium]